MGNGLAFDAELSVRPRGAISRLLGGFLLACLLVGAGPALDFAHVGGGALASGVLIAGLILAALSLIGVARLDSYARGTVAIDPDRVRLGGESIPRDRIKSAHYAPAAGRSRSCVRLLGDRDRMLAQIAVPDAAAADRVLDALELGPRQRTARFEAFAPNGSAARRAGVGFLVAGLVMMIAAIPIHMPWLIGAALLTFIGASATFIPCKVHVGADGLFIATRLAPEFVPWSEVVAIEPYPLGVVVRRKNDALEVPTTSRRNLANDRDLAVQRALMARATAALEAFRRGERPDVATRVARGQRTHAEWVRALFDRDGDFRAAPLLDDQLWSVVESATADASARAGAAAVLARQAGDAERSRLRGIAEACTAPGLRIVLDKAASGADDAEVESALEAIGEEEEAERRARA